MTKKEKISRMRVDLVQLKDCRTSISELLQKEKKGLLWWVKLIAEVILQLAELLINKFDENE